MNEDEDVPPVAPAGAQGGCKQLRLGVWNRASADGIPPHPSAPLLLSRRKAKK